MLDIGWSEMLVVAIVALIFLGPKELPNALKTAAHWMRTVRKMAREFQSGVDQIVREAELDEARKSVQQVTRVNIGKEIEKSIDPTGEATRALNEDPTRAAVADAKMPAPAATPAETPSTTPAPAAPAGETRAEPAAADDRPA